MTLNAIVSTVERPKEVYDSPIQNDYGLGGTRCHCYAGGSPSYACRQSTTSRQNA
ncbi:hypothetical protein PILCRDRAFT_818448 [Piloderma croceum F 1598]|uniref:Uncharacterized protein n=1 Tax=Piloderma croceum (strain F 1598) TaxID=765440 RepID=A0A0C3G0G5_PILCF|nr:hypothetical protein PILCRDRAFT_818448 [Piloderma croceum F 1598]